MFVFCQFVNRQMNQIQTKQHMLLLQIRGQTEVLSFFTEYINRPYRYQSNFWHCIFVCLPGHWHKKRHLNTEKFKTWIWSFLYILLWVLFFFWMHYNVLLKQFLLAMLQCYKLLLIVNLSLIISSDMSDKWILMLKLI